MRCLWWQMSKRKCYKNKKQNTFTWLLPSLPLFARVQSICLFTSVTKQSDSDAEKALVERTCWMRETRGKAPHSSCRADSVTMQISPLRPWFLLCDGLHNFWDLFRISKISMANAHSVSLSPKLLSQGQKIDFAPCANSGGTAIDCVSYCVEKESGCILARWEETLNWLVVCVRHKTGEQWCVHDICKYYVLTEIMVFFWPRPKALV